MDRNSDGAPVLKYIDMTRGDKPLYTVWRRDHMEPLPGDFDCIPNDLALDDALRMAAELAVNSEATIDFVRTESNDEIRQAVDRIGDGLKGCHLMKGCEESTILQMEPREIHDYRRG
jgi:hypothetical protein